ncbi:MAG: FG-GAP repeat domain-containing protein [Pirellulales bacterium]
MSRHWRLALAVIAGLAPAAMVAAEKSPEISFQRAQLDSKFRSEGVAVGDFNSDGKMDVAAGSVYYAAPDWKLTPVLEKPQEFDPLNYSDSFCNFADDINGDRRTDLIVVGFPGKETWWFEQPATAGGTWQRHECTPITNNESPSYLDIDGNGQRDLLLGYDPGKFIGYAVPAAAGLWKLVPVSAENAPGTDRFSHGIGAGDVNGDGRTDVLVIQGWWEAPASPSASPWVFHPVNFGEQCSQMYVYDCDGDGDNDVISSSAHQVGIWWHEQKPDGWQTHTIFKDISQTHSLNLVDINGDGLKDIVTGKRWWAHGPKGDINPDAPAVVYWFELSRQGNKPVWTPHQIDDNSGVGTQLEVADVNGDGLLDVVTANKKGAHYFEQVRK